MRKYFGIVVIALALFAFAPNATQPASSNSTEPDQKECDCSNLKALQIELRNAIKLQQAFRNKIPDLRKMEMEGRQSSAELKRWAESDARRGLEEVPGHSGPAQVDYKPWGDHLNYQDDERVTAKFTNEELCRRSDESTAALAEAKKKSACAGIAQAIQVHEDWHLNFCRRIGYRPYWLGMNGADRAQEEVEAYGAQIAVLRAEIAKVIEKADMHVVVDVNTRVQMPPNPLYSAILITNKADIPMSRVSTVNDLIKLEGDGQQQTNGSIEGNCRFTSGLPSTISARSTVETDGLEAKINYNVAGTKSSMTMECSIGGQTGRGMSMPVPINSNNKYDFNLVLEDGATKEFDQGSGAAAQMMAGSGMKISGKGIIRLVFCNSGH
jgi:hypothetical protein